MLMTKSEGHKMVEIAVDLMTILKVNEVGLGTREIGRTFGISTTSAQRLVTSLERKKCLDFDEVTKKYKLGAGVLRFSRGIMGKVDIIQVAQPYMEKLCQLTNETICLNMSVENHRMTIYQVESKQELRYTAEIGKLYPIYIGASGKSLLAQMEESQINEILNKYVSETKRSSLIEEVHRIKNDNYSVTHGERISGGVGIATPLMVNGLIYSLSIYAPNNRINDEQIKKYISALQEAVTFIEEVS